MPDPTGGTPTRLKLRSFSESRHRSSVPSHDYLSGGPHPHRMIQNAFCGRVHRGIRPHPLRPRVSAGDYASKQEIRSTPPDQIARLDPPKCAAFLAFRTTIPENKNNQNGSQNKSAGFRNKSARVTTFCNYLSESIYLASN